MTRTALWFIALSATCVFVARLLGDPSDSFGGPVLHVVVLAASGVLAATSYVLLVRRRGR